MKFRPENGETQDTIRLLSCTNSVIVKSVSHRTYRNSSANHLLVRLKRTRSVGRLPYEDSDRKMIMKTSFHPFSCLNLRMAEQLQCIIWKN